VQLAGILAGDRRYRISDRVELPLGQREIVLKFYLPEFFNEKRNQYRWRLAGRENQFGPYSSRTSVEYQRLEPGRYEFQLEAISGTGQHSTMRRPLVVIVPPYFYETLAFNIFLILLGLGTTIGLVWWRVHHIELRNRLLEKLVDERTRELQEALVQLEESHKYELEAERLNTAQQMAASVAHEFNNPLAVVSGIMQLNKRKIDAVGDDKLSNSMDKIPRMVDRMHALVQKLLNITEVKAMDYAAGFQIMDLQDGSGEENDSAAPNADSVAQEEDASAEGESSKGGD
jgi:signal transduction histidine kinase